MGWDGMGWEVKLASEREREGGGLISSEIFRC
jgi:hypothetical protein